MVFALLVSVITSARIAGAITANAITQFRIARSNRPVMLEKFMPSRLLNTGIIPTFAKLVSCWTRVVATIKSP
tara:strand:- start:275 stop:493 length:219 start_codon:yes stop_codon:yes gene_type:complete